MFKPAIFSAFAFSSLRSDLCPPEQNLYVSHFMVWQISPNSLQEISVMSCWVRGNFLKCCLWRFFHHLSPPCKFGTWSTWSYSFLCIKKTLCQVVLVCYSTGMSATLWKDQLYAYADQLHRWVQRPLLHTQLFLTLSHFPPILLSFFTLLNNASFGAFMARTISN